MEITYSWKSFFLRGRGWIVQPSWAPNFYDCIECEPVCDPEYDSHPIKPEILDWLKELPRGSWSVDYESRPYDYSAEYFNWNRPIRFRHKRDVIRFKLMFELVFG